MSEKAPHQPINVQHAFDHELRQAQAELDLYMENRPYEDANGAVHDPENGQFINSDQYFDGQRDIHEENSQTTYEDMGMFELARKLAEAEVHNDRTSMRNINDVLLDKIIAQAEKAESARGGNVNKGARSQADVDDHASADDLLVERVMKYKDDHKAKLLTPEESDTAQTVSDVEESATQQVEAPSSDVAEPVEYGPERPSDLQLIRSRNLKRARDEAEMIESIDPQKLNIFAASRKLAQEQRKPSSIVEDAVVNKIEQALELQSTEETPYGDLIDAADQVRVNTHAAIDTQEAKDLEDALASLDDNDQDDDAPVVLKRRSVVDTNDKKPDEPKKLRWRDRLKRWANPREAAYDSTGEYNIKDIEKARKEGRIAAGIGALALVGTTYLAAKGIHFGGGGSGTKEQAVGSVPFNPFKGLSTHDMLDLATGKGAKAAEHYERTHLGELFNLQGSPGDPSRLQLVHEHANNLVTLQTADGTVVAEHLHLGQHGLTPESLQQIHDAGYDTSWDAAADSGRGVLHIFKK